MLIVNRRSQHDDAGGFLSLEARDCELRVDRIAGEHRVEEATRLLEKGDQGIADEVWKLPGPGRSLNEHLKTVREKIRIAAPTAVFAIVVNGVVVARCRLKSTEQAFGDRSRRNVEGLADAKVLEAESHALHVRCGGKALL